MRKLSVLVVLIILCTGCSSDSKEVTTICTIGDTSLNEGQERMVTLEGVDDILMILEEKTSINLSQYNKSDEDILIQIQETNKENTEKYQGIEGVRIDETVKDKIYTRIVTADFSKASMEDLIKAGIVVSSSEKVNDISFDKSVEKYEKDNYSCVEKE